MKTRIWVLIIFLVIWGCNNSQVNEKKVEQKSAPKIEQKKSDIINIKSPANKNLIRDESTKIRIKYYYHYEIVIFQDQNENKENSDYENMKDSDYYFDIQSYDYPQIEGLKNKKFQDSLNKELRPDTNTSIYTKIYKSTGEVVVCKYLDSSKTPSKFDKIKTKNRKIYNKSLFKIYSKYTVNSFNTSSSQSNINVKIYKNRYLNLNYSSYMEGGAHPDSGEFGKVFDAETGKYLKLEDIFNGNYLEEIKEIMQSNEIEHGNETCREAETLKTLWIKSLNENTDISSMGNNGFTLLTDVRNFGCGENDRENMEIEITWEEMKEYLK